MEAVNLEWREDVLPGFEQAPLPPATLIRRAHQPREPRGIVLHVHGYNDYFFQDHMADAFAEFGCAFYAVDMRRAGRSLRAGDKPHHIAHIKELGDDIGAAVAAARADAGDLPVIVHAHSTGGLATAIWASDSPDPHLAGVILNSPFFGLVLTRGEQLAMKLTPALSRMRSTQVVARVPSHYTVALKKQGGWPMNPEWKKPGGEPTTAGWLNATREAQRRVARGLNINVPVLVAHCDSTGPDRADNPRHQSQDVVVDVRLTAAYAAGLGTDVKAVVIEGAIHDLALSAPGPREKFFSEVGSFVDTVLK